MKRTLSVILAVVMIFTIIPTTLFMSSAAAKCPKGHTYVEHYCKTCKKFETNYTGMAKKNSEWCYVTNGKADTAFTGLAKNDYGWWYMTNGKIDYKYVGMAKNQYGWWYIQNGTINFKYTGMAKNQYGWFYMKNGKLDSTYTGMAKNQYGWFYMKNGKLDSTYTGIAKNDYGSWYMKNGKLDSTYNGTYTDKSGVKWNVVNGKAAKKSASTTKTTTKVTTKATTKPASGASTKYLVDPVEYKFANPIGKIKKAWIVSKFDGINIRISRVELDKTITQTFDSKINNQIVNPKTISYKPTCSVAVVDVDDPTQLKISTGNEKPKSVEDWAKSVNAVIAINGTGSKDGFKENLSAVIRNGSVYKSYTGPNPIKTDRVSWQRLIMYKDGRWENKPIDNATAKKIVADGAYNSVRHQGVVIWDGKSTGIAADNGTYRNRAYLGQISAKKYVMMTTEFMPIKDAVEVLKAYGCKKAVQVNGGNCTQMYVNGIGNTTGSTGASITPLNKVGYLETEWYAMKGLLDPKKGGGPCADKLDVIYFK